MLTTLPSKSTAHVRRTACAADARDAQLPKQRRSISDRVTHARPRVQRAQRRSCKARTVTGRAQHSMLRAPASAHPLGFFRRGWRARSCGTPGHSKRRGSDSLRSAQPCDASTAELQNWGRTGRRGSFVPYNFQEDPANRLRFLHHRLYIYWCPKVASATSFFGDEKSNNRSF